MKQRIATAALVGTLAGAVAGVGETVPPSADAIYDVILRKADGSNTVLHVSLRAEAGKFTAGVTVGPLGPTTVDCQGLTLKGDKVEGVLKATIGFDGYYPQGGTVVSHEYRLDAVVSNGTLRGRFDGPVPGSLDMGGIVEGKLSAPPDLGGHWVMDLQMENGAGDGTLGPKSFGTRVYPKLFMKNGKFVQNLIYGWGGRVQINYFESMIVTNDLRFDGKALSGALVVKTTSGTPYVFTLDGTIAGTRIGGTFKKSVDGKEVTGGSFHGSLKSMPAYPPDQAVYYLELHQAVLRTWSTDGHGLQLMVSAPCVQGKFGDGVAFAAAWNHAYHDIDASGLRRDGAALTGELKATMHPDPYMPPPPDNKQVPAKYTIDAKVVDGRIVRGTYTGMFKDRKVSGPVYGELLEQPVVPEPVSVNVKMEEGVDGGLAWHRRTWVNFVATNGVAEKGGMYNNKGGWKGTFRRAEVKFEGARFTATVEGSVDETGGPKKGNYLFKLDGKAVGDQLVGSVTTFRNGEKTNERTDFMGGFGPAR